MSLKKLLETYFKSETLEMNFQETFNNVSISIKYNMIPDISKEFISQIMSKINKRDKQVNIELKISDLEPIQLDVSINQMEDNIDDFLNTIEINKKIMDQLDKSEISIYIGKNDTLNRLSIYDLEAFETYLKRLTLSQIINNLHRLKKNKVCIFEIQDYIGVYSYSEMFCFISLDNSTQRAFEGSSNIEKRKSVCNFFNGEEYQFDADDFKFNKEIKSGINNIFDKLTVVYSLISIFNFSKITEDILKITLNGYKNVKFSFEYKSIKYEDISLYYDIYKWIYSEGTLSDKIELARNIISLYLSNSQSVKIDKSVLDAIKSNYKIYLKDNVEKYFEIKSKAVEEILKMVDEIGANSKNIAEGILKNLKAMGTFIITVIVMNSLSDKKLKNIFTDDITKISIGLCIISIIYLVYTIRDAYDKKKDIITKYYRLKLSYNDILAKKDIENIFRKDRVFKKDIKNMDKKVKYYTEIWIIIITVFLVTILVGRG